MKQDERTWPERHSRTLSEIYQSQYVVAFAIAYGLTLTDDKVKPEENKVVWHRDPLRMHGISEICVWLRVAITNTNQGNHCGDSLKHLRVNRAHNFVLVVAHPVKRPLSMVYKVMESMIASMLDHDQCCISVSEVNAYLENPVRLWLRYQMSAQAMRMSTAAAQERPAVKTNCR